MAAILTVNRKFSHDSYQKMCKFIKSKISKEENPIAKSQILFNLPLENVQPKDKNKTITEK